MSYFYCIQYSSPTLFPAYVFQREVRSTPLPPCLEAFDFPREAVDTRAPLSKGKWGGSPLRMKS